MIIAFTGGMGSGKSTAIYYAGQKLIAPGKGLTIIKFADPIYEMQEFAYSRISPVYVRPKEFKKDRRFLQTVGDWGRELDKNLFVNLWKYWVRAYSEGTVFCDDVRFENEADAVHDLGGYVIKLIRPKAYEHAEGGEGIKGHISEEGISARYCDFVVQNSSDINEFYKKLNEVFEQITVRENQKTENERRQ